MKPLFLLLLLLTMCAKPQPPSFRECPCTHTDPKKRLYNQVLTELIEQRFYSSYLPDSANEQIREAIQLQFPQGSDFKLGTEEFRRYETVRKELEAVQQNRLFGDSARFKTIYLDTDLRRGIHPFTLPPASQATESPDAFSQLNIRINLLFSQVVRSDTADAIHQLNALQSDILPTDFQLCTAKIISRPSTSKRRFNWERTTVRFSKIVFNATQTKALLRYDMSCGSKCGFGEILLVEKTNGNWHIKQAEELWIS
ncbi:hypothetical protein [Hymenobacter rubidus]|uniref:hypothetical protein n=1 Tax=Hymenobacter rubidus TaxID=1441626 RepID=UPI00191E3A37|nr:hypothetical protein [Hymenobacter rubidus]